MNETAVEKWSPDEIISSGYDAEFVVWGEYGDEWLGARPYVITLESLRGLYDLHSQHDSFFPDYLKRDFDLWAWRMIECTRFPMEVVTLPSKEHVGFMYLTDVFKSDTEDEIVECFGHFSFWEGKVGEGRRGLMNDVIELLARAYKIHRMSVRIPVYAVGAIRQAKKLGFGGGYITEVGKSKIMVEGVLRKASKYHGEWHDVVVMSRVGKELE